MDKGSWGAYIKHTPNDPPLKGTWKEALREASASLSYWVETGSAPVETGYAYVLPGLQGALLLHHNAVTDHAGSCGPLSRSLLRRQPRLPKHVTTRAAA